MKIIFKNTIIKKTVSAVEKKNDLYKKLNIKTDEEFNKLSDFIQSYINFNHHITFTKYYRRLHLFVSASD